VELQIGQQLMLTGLRESGIQNHTGFEMFHMSF